MAWVVETLNDVVDGELDALPADIRARFVRLVQLIEQHGLATLPRDAVKHLEDKLWELRLSGRSGIARTIYVTATGERIVILHAFVKKTQKTPRQCLELARQRAKDVK